MLLSSFFDLVMCSISACQSEILFSICGLAFILAIVEEIQISLFGFVAFIETRKNGVILILWIPKLLYIF